jgi:hypothetical protein
MSSNRTCSGTTRKGTPCKAAPLKGTDRCLAHTDKEARGSIRFGGPQPGSGRKPLPKPTELARQLVERHVTAIFRPHFKALGLMLHDDGTTTKLDTGAIVVHHGQATGIEDLGAQIAAARELLDRVYGKPRQATETSGPDGSPIEQLIVPTDADRARKVATILAEAGAAGTRAQALNGHGNGNGSR